RIASNISRKTPTSRSTPTEPMAGQVSAPPRGNGEERFCMTLSTSRLHRRTERRDLEGLVLSRRDREGGAARRRYARRQSASVLSRAHRRRRRSRLFAGSGDGGRRRRL